jgi:hypothetical protein
VQLNSFSRLFFHFSLLCVVAGVATQQAHAASSVGSSVYESAAALVGSLSNSVNRSSNSSSKNNGVAAGEYKLIAVAAAPDRTGFVNLTLQAVAEENTMREFVLTLPVKAFEVSALGKGDHVLARDRSYGTEFANSQTKTAFFLVVRDDTFRELSSNAVVL